MRYEHILRAMSNEVWAIDERKFHQIRAVLRGRALGERLTEDEIEDRIGADASERNAVAAAEPSTPTAPGAVAVIRIFGIVAQRMDLFMEMSGGTSTERVAKQFRQALADPNIGSIVLQVDSPGGGVSGVPELGDLIYESRGQKPITAVVDSLMASAAYWIGSQADEIVITPSGEVGSVGVFLWVENWQGWYEKAGIEPRIIRYGEHKAEVNDFEPLSDDTLAYLQQRVDDLGEQFVRAVARGRGLTSAQVKAEFGQGRMFGPKQAVKIKMVDRIGTFDDTLQKLASGRRRSGTRADSAEDQSVDVAVHEPAAADRDALALALALHGRY